MYIQPGTNIRLLNNCPLEPGYKHTILFDSATAQSTYFLGLTKYNLSNYSYQRHTRGSLRVGILADNLYDINYMMFQNESFGNKWFYAFVTNVEYINNVTSEIYFEIDEMQTWLFDFSLAQCFVDREHSATDEPGDNILPEPIELGEYTYNTYNAISDDLDDLAVVVGVSDTEEATVDGNIYDGVYSGVKYRAFNADDITSINNYLASYKQSPDSVVIMYMSPVACVIPLGTTIPTGGTDIPSRDSAPGTTIELPDFTAGSSQIDGYVPKNNKLYTYPYHFMQIDNGSAQTLSLRYEFFSSKEAGLFADIDPNISPPVKVTLRPRNYKGCDRNLTETLTLENYPQCSWNMDSYKVWLSQNMVPYQIKAGSSIVNIVSSFALSTIGGASQGGIGAAAGAMSGAANAVSSAVNLISGYMSDKYTASIAADLCKGNVNNGNNNIANGYQNFYVGRMSIKADYARVIDDFFNTYGYATKRIKTPNRTSRPHWNYVKTVNCRINGSIPADSERVICGIHDNGITYWKNASELGNYTLDNSI